MVGTMALSCSSTKLDVCNLAQVSGYCTNTRTVTVRGLTCVSARPGAISLAACRINGNMSRSTQLVRGARVPGVRRCGGGELKRPPQLGRADKLGARPLRREAASNLVVCSLPVPSASSVQVATTMFMVATAFVVPFYTTMILAPQWKWTKKIVENDLSFIVLGAMYVYLLSLSWTPETLGLMFASKYYLPELPGITRMFTSTITVASAWIHLLTADLFCGRYVFLDGLQHKVETRHSLVLCLMMCPIGIISHLVTKAITLFVRRADGEDAVDMEKVLV